MRATEAILRRGRGFAWRMRAILAAAFAVACLGLATRSLTLGIALSTPVPISDQWEVVTDLMRIADGRYTLLDLFSQHNEHRIATARPSFFFDAWCCHLDNLSVVLTNYLMLALLAVVLAMLATRGRPPLSRLLAALAALAMLWSTGGYINLGWAFQLQWAYVHLFPALAIVAFALAARRPGLRAWTLLAAACLADALGAFSMASGLCTVGPVVAVAIWMRAPWRLLAAFCLWHAVVVALFLWGYEAPPQELVLAPLPILRYLAPFLGTALPLSKHVSILLGDAALVLITLAAAALTTAALVRRRPAEPGIAALAGIALFCVAEGVASAFGRASLADPTSLALRYGTPSNVFWAALLLAAWRWSAITGRVGLARATAAAALCGILASNMLGDSVRNWHDWSARADRSGFDLINGVTTGRAALALYPWPHAIQDRIAFLRDHGLGPFAAEESRFRAPLNSLDATPPSGRPACVGEADRWSLDPDGQLHASGWAMTRNHAISPLWIAAYAGPRLIGYAPTGGYRIDRERLSGRSVVLGYDAWFHLAAPAEADAVSLVAIFPGGTVPPCRAPAGPIDPEPGVDE